MEPCNVVPSEDNGPFAVETSLGWVINGPLDVSSDGQTSSMFFTSACNRIVVSPPLLSLDDQLCNHFNYDFSERIIDDIQELSKQDKHFLDIASKSIEHINGHYVIDLPFRSKQVEMPNNRKQAEQRLMSLSKRFRGDNEFRTQYTTFMDKIISEGYGIVVKKSELSKENGRIWYLPHHGVYHPRKKKMRVVFDCAAIYGGTSLNDKLLQGPNLTNTLIGTLIRFRQDEVALMGDIDGMFHQVRVSEKDTDFLRFLWWENGDCSKQPIEYKMNVHIFGATSSPSCANYALRQTAENGRGQLHEVIETVLRNFYVDDCLKSVSNAEDAICHVKDLRSLLETGGFRIAKLISSDRNVIKQIPINERAKDMKDLDLDHDSLPIDRALGVQWCVDSDAFCFKIVLKEQPLTRRGILSMISSVFDPLGFLAPFTVSGKMILQELCRLYIGWDDLIPQTISEKWTSWWADLQNLSNFTVARCVKPPSFGSIKSAELHTFSDASESGYGTVTYLRLENENAEVHCAFIIGKARVAPLKQVTIPRLELTAAVVGVRTNKMLLNELDIPVQRSIFWTDSMSLLRYIRNTTARFQTFVANRLSVIHEGSNYADWHYVPTKLNPADLDSRGVSATQLLQKDQWIKAPEFLLRTENEWPGQPLANFDTTLNNDPEIKRVKKQAFHAELECLEEGKPQVKRTSHIRTLDPINDNGLLRVGGRLHESNLPSESKHPIILPKNHHVSELILRQIHIDLKHSGRNHMLSFLRQRFWIVNAPSAIRKIISKCVTCRKQRSPIGEQKMANLPYDRLVPDEPPFTRVGVDYFGPFEVKIKRSHVKRYGVLFTCLTSRAVHLEVAASLDTDSYINALRRFISRRGQVKKIRSDNGTNFVGAEKELQRSLSDWNSDKIQDAMLQRNIDWQFNPPAGSHHGGVWERMIRSVRKVMNSVLREQVLDDEGLHTLMCEIEAILNSRPITRNSDNHSDLEPLTPNHLLLMKQEPILPPGIFNKCDNSADDAGDRFSTWLIYSGRDGYASTYRYSKSVRNGTRSNVT